MTVARAVWPSASAYHRALWQYHRHDRARPPQVALDLDPQAPSRFRMKPPGFLLHWWHPVHGLVTDAAPIGDHGPAYPFFDDRGG